MSGPTTRPEQETQSSSTSSTSRGAQWHDADTAFCKYRGSRL